jgi:hypothetical protein
MQLKAGVDCRTRSVTIALAATVLLGCGGGGGGGIESTVPANSQREVPLALTASNASDAATLGLGYGSLGLAFGQLAVDWTEAIAEGGGAALTLTCPGGGAGNVRWTDVNGNGVVGAGDQLTATLEACHLKPLEDSFSGTLTVSLRAPGTGLQRAGLIAMGPTFGSATVPPVRVAGELEFDLAADRVAKVLRVRSSVQPLVFSATDGSQTVADVVSQMQLRREVRRDTARVSTSIAHRLSSDLLRGEIVVSTEQPWTNWFDSVPDAGALLVRGAGAPSVRLLAPAPAATSFDVRLDGASVGSVFVADAATGYLWSGTGWAPQDETQRDYLILPAGDGAFVQLTRPEAATIAPNPGPFVWTYSRPLAPDAVTSAAFVRRQSAPGPSWAPSEIPAELSIEGAMLTVTPLQQFEPGDTYEVMFDRTFAAPGITDTLGRTTTRPAYTATVAQTVQANAVFDGPALILGKDTGAVTLDARTSVSATTGGTQARWRQISGPALAFGGADNAVVSMQTTESLNGIAVVELEARNVAGDIDRLRLQFPVLGDLSQAFAIGVTVGPGPMKVVTSVDGIVASNMPRYFASANAVDVLPSTGGRFLATPPPGESWRSGLVFGYGTFGTGILVWLPPDGASCNSADRGGLVNVLDIGFDAAGELQRLAVEFDEFCDGVQTHGSIRFNNALPLRSR